LEDEDPELSFILKEVIPAKGKESAEASIVVSLSMPALQKRAPQKSPSRKGFPCKPAILNDLTRGGGDPSEGSTGGDRTPQKGGLSWGLMLLYIRKGKKVLHLSGKGKGSSLPKERKTYPRKKG